MASATLRRARIDHGGHAAMGWSRSRCADRRRRTPRTPRCGTNCLPSSTRSHRTGRPRRRARRRRRQLLLRSRPVGRAVRAMGHRRTSSRRCDTSPTSASRCTESRSRPWPRCAASPSERAQHGAVVRSDRRIRQCSVLGIFAKRGLSLDFGGSWLLPRLVGMHRAKELALLAEIVGRTRR